MIAVLVSFCAGVAIGAAGGAVVAHMILQEGTCM